MNKDVLRRWISITVVLVCAGLVVALGQRVRSLRAGLEDVIEQVSYAHAGIYTPRVEAATLEGDRVIIGESADSTARQLLLFFTTTCPYCRASIPAWKTLASELSGEGAIDVVGIALDSVHLAEEYVRDHSLPFPVVSLLHPKYVQLFRARAVPMILVVQGDGEILYARRGALETPAAIDSVRTAVRAPAAPVTAAEIANSATGR